MPAIVVRILCVASALMLSACVTFTNGVVDKPLPNDERLIGAWHGDGDNSSSWLVIATDGPTSLSITGSDDSACKKNEGYSAKRTQIENHDYLDLAEVTDSQSLVKIGPIGYEFRSVDRLAVFTADGDAFTQAVESGELAGKITKPSRPDEKPFVEVQASTADLRQWIAAHPASMHGKPIEFVRRDSAMAPHCT